MIPRKVRRRWRTHGVDVRCPHCNGLSLSPSFYKGEPCFHCRRCGWFGGAVTDDTGKILSLFRFDVDSHRKIG